jgi:hypothetical protein
MAVLLERKQQILERFLSAISVQQKLLLLLQIFINCLTAIKLPDM